MIQQLNWQTLQTAILCLVYPRNVVNIPVRRWHCLLLYVSSTPPKRGSDDDLLRSVRALKAFLYLMWPMFQTVRKCENKSSSAKLSSRSISKAVRSVIRGNVAVRSADHVKNSLHNSSRFNCKNRRHALGAWEEINLANVRHPTALGAGVENGNTRQLSLVEALIWRHCPQYSFHFCGVPVMYRDAVPHRVTARTAEQLLRSKVLMNINSP